MTKFYGNTLLSQPCNYEPSVSACPKTHDLATYLWEQTDEDSAKT